MDDNGCNGVHGSVFTVQFFIELVNHRHQISSQFFPARQDNLGRYLFVWKPTFKKIQLRAKWRAMPEFA
jgi:hypothetical protein